MTALETDILQALVALDSAVKSMPTTNPKPNLLPLFTQLDTLAAQLPRDASPDLRHYLQKKSYEKARLFLQGQVEDITPGACGHV